jgi:hypothetical protein
MVWGQQVIHRLYWTQDNALKLIFPCSESSFFLALIFVKLKAESTPVWRRYGVQLSGRTESFNKSAAPFYLVTLMFSVLEYLCTPSCIMLLIFSLCPYPVQLCLLALLQHTQVYESPWTPGLKHKLKNSNFGNSLVDTFQCTHISATWIRGQLVHTDNLKTKALRGYKEGFLWMYIEGDCIGTKQMAMEFYCF